MRPELALRVKRNGSQDEKPVMRGLDARIHKNEDALRAMDCRLKPDNDGFPLATPPLDLDQHFTAIAMK
jgi:hypothetical protein